MKIKRKIEMLVSKNEKYVIRKSSTHRQIPCAECGEPMLTAEQTAKMFGITQRRIFRIIETGAAHFTEAEAGALMICLNSLAAVLDRDSEKKLEEINEG